MNIHVQISQFSANQWRGILTDCGLYFHAATRTEIERIAKSVWILFYKWKNSDFVSADSPILIGGSGRSGTTLLYRMIHSHPNIALGLETNFFTQTPYILQYFPLPRHIVSSDTFVQLIDSTHRMDKQEIQEIVRNSMSYPHFIENFFHSYMKKKEKIRWGDKTPQNIYHLDFIRKHFPHSTFIHIIRDGRDVACSFRNSGNKTWPECVQAWINAIQAGLNYRHEPWFLEIRYEDLVYHPHRELGRIFQLIDEPEDYSVINHFQRDELKYLEGFSIHDNVFQNVNAKSIGRWKKEINPEEKKILKDMASEYLALYGYADTQDW